MLLHQVPEELTRVAALALVLLKNLGLGWKWASCLAQLVAFALLLLPGFAQVVVHYITSKRIHKSVSYGQLPRNRMDIHLPAGRAVDDCVPVIVYITGGAWIIGYKAWGALLAKRLSQAGALVCCLDYRNFPQGTIVEMMEDVTTALGWISSNIHTYGGDPEQMLLVGQSAGAQLAALAILFQGLPDNTPHPAFRLCRQGWNVSQISGFVGLSGTYNIPGLAMHLNNRGLHRALFDKIMAKDKVQHLEFTSPLHVLDSTRQCCRTYIPAFHLVHGEEDKSVPVDVAIEFANCLKVRGANMTLTLYKNKSHTQLMIEDSLHGGYDHTIAKILEAMGCRDVITSYKPLVPSVLVDLASKVCPF